MARKHTRNREKKLPVDNPRAEEEANPPIQGLDDVDDLLSEMDADVVIDEPDEMVLAQEAEELSTAPEDDTLELLSPALEADLGEDPVRLYLREIGEIELLSVD